MEIEKKEEALAFAKVLMGKYWRHDQDMNEIRKSLYGLAKRWKLSYSFEDYTVNGSPCTEAIPTESNPGKQGMERRKA